jgi:hypothetical protein
MHKTYLATINESLLLPQLFSTCDLLYLCWENVTTAAFWRSLARTLPQILEMTVKVQEQHIWKVQEKSLKTISHDFLCQRLLLPVMTFSNLLGRQQWFILPIIINTITNTGKHFNTSIIMNLISWYIIHYNEIRDDSPQMEDTFSINEVSAPLPTYRGITKQWNSALFNVVHFLCS